MSSALATLLGQNMYTLKREYGSSATFCHLQSSETDYLTGEKRVSYAAVALDAIIALPNTLTTTLVASVARISTNKLLAYGGQYHVGDRGFIVDGSDLNWPIRQDDWIIHKGNRYSPTMIVRMFQGTAWFVTARNHPGQPLTFHVAGYSDLLARVEVAHG